eukprot:5164187-Pyramimonas_sp.AAC.1
MRPEEILTVSAALDVFLLVGTQAYSRRAQAPLQRRFAGKRVVEAEYSRGQLTDKSTGCAIALGRCLLPVVPH